MKNLAKKLVSLALPVLTIAGAGILSNNIPKNIEMEYMARGKVQRYLTAETYIAVDRNKDGTPDVIINGFMGPGFFPGGILMREPTEEEIKNYRSLSK